MNLTFSAEFYPCGKPDPVPGRAGILALENAIRSMPEDVQHSPDLVDEMTTHYFAPGLYARRLDRKAGDVIVGKIHKHDHLAMVVSGELTIVDEFGSRRVKGPHVFLSKAGAKRATYAHTDAIFMTFHPTDETDLEVIEREVTADSYEDLEQFLLEKMQ